MIADGSINPDMKHIEKEPFKIIENFILSKIERMHKTVEAQQSLEGTLLHLTFSYMCRTAE